MAMRKRSLRLRKSLEELEKNSEAGDAEDEGNDGTTMSESKDTSEHVGSESEAKRSPPSQPHSVI